MYSPGKVGYVMLVCFWAIVLVRELRDRPPPLDHPDLHDWTHDRLNLSQAEMDRLGHIEIAFEKELSFHFEKGDEEQMMVLTLRHFDHMDKYLAEENRERLRTWIRRADQAVD